jgi:DNA-binding response OmpR family regulator
MRILVVEDEAEVSDLLSRTLERDGHAVRTASSVADAEAQASAQTPDLIVLDVALGTESGLDFCRALRKRGLSTPLLVLTAHSEVPRRLEGFEAGADDFLAKPFAVAELRARVRALGRRGAMTRPSHLNVGDVALDLSARRATRRGHDVPITAREWAVLDLLGAHRDRVLGRLEILESIWGDTGEAASASLDVIVARIRRKLGSGVVRTVRGEGYALGAA